MAMGRVRFPLEMQTHWTGGWGGTRIGAHTSTQLEIICVLLSL